MKNRRSNSIYGFTQLTPTLKMIVQLTRLTPCCCGLCSSYVICLEMDVVEHLYESDDKNKTDVTC